MKTNRFLENLRGIIIAAMVFAMTVAPVFLHSPVRSVSKVEATVEAIMVRGSRVGTSSQYTYLLRLENGATVMASDYLSRPHLKGTSVTLERVIRENGRASYRFPFFGGSMDGGMLALLAPERG